ncbi:hypothetical protein [Mycobacteroides abscessus]
MPLVPVTSELETTRDASEVDIARKVAAHLGLLRDEQWRIYSPDGEQIATTSIDLYDHLSTLMWVDAYMIGNSVARPIHWTRITGVPDLVDMARRRRK